MHNPLQLSELHCATTNPSRKHTYLGKTATALQQYNENSNTTTKPEPARRDLNLSPAPGHRHETCRKKKMKKERKKRSLSFRNTPRWPDASKQRWRSWHDRTSKGEPLQGWGKCLVQRNGEITRRQCHESIYDCSACLHRSPTHLISEAATGPGLGGASRLPCDAS